MNEDDAAKDKWSHDEDTKERKKRETTTEATRKRLKKNRTREGGSKCGKAATESEEAGDQD